MVWTHGENGWVPYGKKGVDGVSNWKAGTGQTEVRMMDSVKVALNSRDMTIEAAQQCAKDRKEWRTIVHM